MDEPNSPSLCEPSNALPIWNDPRLCLIQSKTDLHDVSSLECTELTPNPYLQPTSAPRHELQETVEYSYGIDSIIYGHKEGTPVTPRQLQRTNTGGLVMLSDPVMVGFDDENANWNHSRGSESSDGEISDIEEISDDDDYDSDNDSDPPMTTLLTMISETEEDTALAESGYKKYNSLFVFTFQNVSLTF